VLDRIASERGLPEAIVLDNGPEYPARDEESLGWLNVTRSVWRSTVGNPKTAKSKAPVPVIPQLAQRLDAHRKKCGNPVAGPIFANSV
jgi:hypothetical protein